MAKVCKKCEYERKPDDTAPEYECPNCGAVYAKVEALLNTSDKLDQDMKTNIPGKSSTAFRTGQSREKIAREGNYYFSPMHIVFAVGFLIIASSVGYYFLVVLPEAEQQRVIFEKARIDMELARIDMELKKESDRRMDLLNCQAEVERQRNDYLKMHGTPVEGTEQFSISEFHVRQMNSLQRQGDMECVQMYGKK
jgi:hypothetical protein